MARKKTLSEAEKEQVVWDYFIHHPTRDFFKDITISPDGGFSEVMELWRPTRWCYATVTFAVLVMNLYYTFLIDILLILKPSSNKGLVLISRATFQFLANVLMDALERPRYTISADKWVACVELILTSHMLLQVVYCSIVAVTALSPKVKWFNAQRLWWHVIPNLYSYSAMRLLHFVSPQVFPIHFSKFIHTHGFIARVEFVLLRAMALVVGFDAFMLKCRESREFIEGSSRGIASLWAGFAFLRQVLGIVQVNFEVQDRVFSFMFAGEDGIMQEEEKYKKNVWQAMLVSEIFKQFKQHWGCRLGTAKAMALMLSFDDHDFQKLFLDQSPDTGRPLLHESSSCSEDDSQSSEEDSAATAIGPCSCNTDSERSVPVASASEKASTATGWGQTEAPEAKSARAFRSIHIVAT